MAQIEESGQGRQTNVDVNLVPFIDLMSVLVIFLLITAVWTQVSMIQIGSSIYGKRTSDKNVEPPPRAEIPFRVDVKPFGHRVNIGRIVVDVPKKQGQYDLERLFSELKVIKDQYKEKVDCVITMSDELAYVNLVNAMDMLLRAGFPQISISTAEAAN